MLVNLRIPHQYFFFFWFFIWCIFLVNSGCKKTKSGSKSENVLLIISHFISTCIRIVALITVRATGGLIYVIVYAALTIFKCVYLNFLLIYMVEELTQPTKHANKFWFQYFWLWGPQSLTHKVGVKWHFKNSPNGHEWVSMNQASAKTWGSCIQ